jgi:hypothetical protein
MFIPNPIELATVVTHGNNHDEERLGTLIQELLSLERFKEKCFGLCIIVHLQTRKQ